MSCEHLPSQIDQFEACQALVYSLLRHSESAKREHGLALALVSSHPEAGVSYVLHLLELMLNENEANCAVALDCEALGLGAMSLPEHGKSVGSFSRVMDGRAQEPQTSLTHDLMKPRYHDRVEDLNALLSAYRFVLLDYHSLKENGELLGMASLLDGIIIVVECDRTTSNQLDELERSIERYGGSILGTVLNKTRTPIPTWMNSLMEKAGV
jgi:hypothetical protein